MVHFDADDTSVNASKVLPKNNFPNTKAMVLLFRVTNLHPLYIYLEFRLKRD